MPVIPGGTLACPATDLQRRLAARLAAMIPGAASISVGFTGPRKSWPSPYAAARTESGQPIALGRTTATTAARWILRAWPEQDWRQPHILDLGTATLACDDTTSRSR